MGVLSATALFVRALVLPSLRLVAENLALRQQLAVLHTSGKRPKLRPRDRLFWILLRLLWKDWKSVLGNRPARNRRSLAQIGLSPLLALEVDLRQTWEAEGAPASFGT